MELHVRQRRAAVRKLIPFYLALFKALRGSRGSGAKFNKMPKNAPKNSLVLRLGLKKKCLYRPLPISAWGSRLALAVASTMHPKLQPNCWQLSCIMGNIVAGFGTEAENLRLKKDDISGSSTLDALLKPVHRGVTECNLCALFSSRLVKLTICFHPWSVWNWNSCV